MALPDLIEIVPLQKPVRAEITVPGSKSITNRALILAALADGQTTLQGALWSEDTQVMVEALRRLGFELHVEPDREETCNRTIKVKGSNGKIPNAGRADEPLEIFVGNAGTAARFLAALVCLGDGAYRLHGVPRMHERPQAGLFQALRELGYRIDSPNDRLPAIIHGAGPRAGRCSVSIEESSQFASALLLCAEVGRWRISTHGENVEESAYLVMTKKMLEVFPKRGGTFDIEADASSGSYFLAAGPFESAKSNRVNVAGEKEHGFIFQTEYRPTVRVLHWPKSTWQIDERFLEWSSLFVEKTESLQSMFESAQPTAVASFEEAGLPLDNDLGDALLGLKGASEKWQSAISRQRDLGDSIMMLIVLAPTAEDPWRFTDLGRLRVQECERVVALRQELTRCGAKVVEEGDTLTVFPSELHGAEIETYNDHRMAMCFAILGLKVPGIKIKNPACVKKTFPNFFQKLAAQPPHGLGAIILDAQKRRPLGVEELFAD